MRTTQAHPAAPARPSMPAPEPLAIALARLEARWGSAAIRLGDDAEPGGGRPRDGRPQDGRTGDGLRPHHDLRLGDGAGQPWTEGALALAPSAARLMVAPSAVPLGPEPSSQPRPAPALLPGEVVSTGFTALDAILATGGLPRRSSATLRGGASSGKTTLALRCVAEAQAAGSIAAWLDLPRAFDPLEATARGVDLGWLVILRPAGAEEGFRLAGALLSGRAVDLLVVDLPPRLPARHASLLRRLAAHARRIGARLLTLQPSSLAETLHAALGEGGGLRLELERRGWIRVGRDVVGQRTAVTVARDRGGPPGHSVELVIRYLDPGERILA